MKKLLLFTFLFVSVICKAQFAPVLKQNTLVLTPLEAVYLYDTPQKLIDAPGANKFIRIIRLAAEIDLNVPTDCCSGGANANVVYGNYQYPNGFYAFGTAQLNTSFDVIGINYFEQNGIVGNIPINDIINQPVYLQGTANFDTNGQLAKLESVKYVVIYQIIEL